ncbi:MAG: FAD-binding oxidoreductase, partial [Candidatus Acidiferrales bacterium]
RFADIVGPDHVALDPEILSSYEIDGVAPAAVTRPGDVQEVAELVRLAAAENLAVIATGSRSKLGIGMPPARYDVAIDMTRLDHIVSYDPGDLTLAVEAGIPLHKLAAVLAEQRQFLPLGVPFFDRTTVGGTIATGVDGPLRQLFGTARDYVLGMEFVTGEGNLTKSGGRVVKNVTGYDLHKLMIGAFGTLGIITKINFRTVPLPATTRGFVATFDTAVAALDFRHRIARSALAPSTIEILSPGVAELLYSDAAARIEPAPLRPSLLSNAKWALTTGYVGSGRVLARYEMDLRRMADEAGATGAAVLSDDLRAAWVRKREFIPIALASSTATTIMKLSVLPTRIAEMLERGAAEAARAGLRWVALARGVGVIYFALLPPGASEDSRTKVSSATARIAAACSEFAGNSTIPWCPAKWKSSLAVWGPERADFAQMKKLKTVFDPRGIFAPGRFAGGL